MNTELKALIALAWDLGALGVDVATSKGTVQEGVDGSKLLTDVPAVFANWSDLSAEIKALPGTAQEADLIAFIASKAAGLGLSVKAETVLANALAWAQSTATLIQSIAAPATAAAPAAPSA